FDPHAADVRVEREPRQAAGLDRAALEVVVEIEQRGEIRREEGHTELVRAGRDRHTDVDRLQLTAAAAAELLVPVEEREALAVEQHLELLAADLAERPEVAHVTERDGEDLDVVLAVGREV